MGANHTRETTSTEAASEAARTSEASTKLMPPINAYQACQAPHAATILGAADPQHDHPQHNDDAAQAGDAHPASMHGPRRALAEIGVVHETENEHFALTPLGACLGGDAPGSRGELPYSVRAGKGVGAFIFGMGPWTYLDQHSDGQSVFDTAMTGLSQANARTVIGAYDFGRFGRIVDIGGGDGHSLTFIVPTRPSAATPWSVTSSRPSPLARTPMS